MEDQKVQIEKKADTKYEIHSLLESRWSPRQFADKAVGREEIHQLLEAARWAASSANGQPWRFLYAFRGTEAYNTLVDHLSDWNQSWVRNAPVLMLTAYKKKFDKGKDNFHAMHDLGLAMGNLSTQAQSMGLAVHSMAGVNWKKAHETYNIPEGFHITTAVAIGYYGGDISQLDEKMRKGEVASRERIPQTEFAGEGEWKL